jgi:hypothetical protein
MLSLMSFTFTDAPARFQELTWHLLREVKLAKIKIKTNGITHSMSETGLEHVTQRLQQRYYGWYH